MEMVTLPKAVLLAQQIHHLITLGQRPRRPRVQLARYRRCANSQPPRQQRFCVAADVQLRSQFVVGPHANSSFLL